MDMFSEITLRDPDCARYLMEAATLPGRPRTLTWWMATKNWPGLTRGW